MNERFLKSNEKVSQKFELERDPELARAVADRMIAERMVGVDTPPTMD